MRIQFISASLTRSASNVQARFRVWFGKDGPHVRSWTVAPSIAKTWLAGFGPQTAFQMLSHLSSMTTADARKWSRDRGVLRECERALRAMCEAGESDARRAKMRERAERNVRGWALSALRNGTSDARLRELLDQALVEHTHET